MLHASKVLSDHRKGMRAAVDHLLDLGHRRIGLILGQPLRPSRERRRGLEEAYQARALPATYEVLEGQLDSSHGREATAKLLDAAEPPTAIVAGGNQILVGALAELRRRNQRIGDGGMSLMSCDEIALTELFEPPIAVVRRDNRELGRRAAQLLLAHLEDEALEPQTVVLPTEFVPRPSCAAPQG
jgi:LacI family transcriptional regulator